MSPQRAVLRFRFRILERRSPNVLSVGDRLAVANSDTYYGDFRLIQVMPRLMAVSVAFRDGLVINREQIGG